MNARRLLPFLILAALSGGCLVETHPDDDDCGGDCGGGGGAPTGHGGDVTFAWTFEELRCADLPDIKGVQVRIDGEPLLNDGFFPCQTEGFAGIVLHDFAPGSYSFTLEAVSFHGDVLYGGGATFVVDGNVRVTIDLTPTGSPSSYAYLSWRFPEVDGYANPTCAKAGIASVDVRIDGGAWKRFACEQGQGAASVRTPYLEPGVHTVELVALDAYDYAYFRFEGSLHTYAGKPVAAEYGLAWAVGGTALEWRLMDGSYTRSCAEARIDTVSINFRDAYGEWLYDWADPAIRFGCTSAPIYFDYLPAGVHTVFMKGTGAGGTYLSDAYSPPVVGVKAGEWPTGAVVVPLFHAP